MAWAMAPLGLALLAAGVLTAFLPGLAWKLAGVLVVLLALVLLGVAWGLQRSAGLSEAAAAEQRLDEVLLEAARVAQGPGADGSVCGSSGLVCGSAGPDGCGASCLAGTRSDAGRGSAPRAR